jgi:plasmid stabilization system protein ParE
MKVRWTVGAADDLEQIVGFIRRGSPESARRVAEDIYERSMALGGFSHKGRKRTSDNAWEIPCHPWPYVIIFEYVGEAIEIQGIVHTSQDRRT